ncbi:orotate phosphoribosyltransferase [Vineibacter terrae]|uniref:orotate phosphoribosyltransferase n=1 Tax=Vineibacter terrae TaxID=2586908 RepID=UPI001C49A4BB|nr:orotate phosphoribosyltransferase [Vineibacter terrae]
MASKQKTKSKAGSARKPSSRPRVGKPAAKAVRRVAATPSAPRSAVNGKAGTTAAARDTARLLLDIKAVHCRPDNPFIFTSGRASPVYIDCRKIISFPDARARIMAHAHKVIGNAIGWSKIDVVAGGETAGIPFAAFIAATAKKPMIYVRKQPKGFGRMAQIEGELKAGDRVLLVEDLATDGGSKVMFIDALRKADAKVTDTFVIFHYGIFQQSVDVLASMGVKLHALATWWDVLDAAERYKLFDERGLTETRAFLNAPDSWSAAHGGRNPGHSASRPTPAIATNGR